jgi:hypothetical protein
MIHLVIIPVVKGVAIAAHATAHAVSTSPLAGHAVHLASHALTNAAVKVATPTQVAMWQAAGAKAAIGSAGAGAFTGAANAVLGVGAVGLLAATAMVKSAATSRAKEMIESAKLALG